MREPAVKPFVFPSDDPDGAGQTAYEFQPPLTGYFWEDNETVVCPLIGSSDPQLFLEALRWLEGKGKRVVFTTVVNQRFVRLLKVRGYTYSPAVAYSKTYQEHVDGWEKRQGPRAVARGPCATS